MKYPRFRQDEPLFLPPRGRSHSWRSNIDGEPVAGFQHDGSFYPDDFADLVGVRAFARIAGIPDQTARQHRRHILPSPLMTIDMGHRRFPVWNRNTAVRYRALIKEDN